MAERPVEEADGDAHEHYYLGATGGGAGDRRGREPRPCRRRRDTCAPIAGSGAARVHSGVVGAAADGDSHIGAAVDTRTVVDDGGVDMAGGDIGDLDIDIDGSHNCRISPVSPALFPFPLLLLSSSPQVCPTSRPRPRSYPSSQRSRWAPCQPSRCAPAANG